MNHFFIPQPPQNTFPERDGWVTKHMEHEVWSCWLCFFMKSIAQKNKIEEEEKAVLKKKGKREWKVKKAREMKSGSYKIIF